MENLSIGDHGTGEKGGVLKGNYKEVIEDIMLQSFTILTLEEREPDLLKKLKF